MGLSILSRGTMDEKLRWIFTLYDINRDGKVTKDELLMIISSIYELMGKCTEPIIDESTAKQHVEVVFKVFLIHLFIFYEIVLNKYMILEIKSKTRRRNYNGRLFADMLQCNNLDINIYVLFIKTH